MFHSGVSGQACVRQQQRRQSVGPFLNFNFKEMQSIAMVEYEMAKQEFAVSRQAGFCPIRPRSVAHEHNQMLILSPRHTRRLPMPAKKPVPKKLECPVYWVKKYADFSSKYGMGFLMSTNTIGVHFNDNSIVIRAQNSEVYLYIRLLKHGEKRID